MKSPSARRDASVPSQRVIRSRRTNRRDRRRSIIIRIIIINNTRRAITSTIFQNDKTKNEIALRPSENTNVISYTSKCTVCFYAVHCFTFTFTARDRSVSVDCRRQRKRVRMKTVGNQYTRSVDVLIVCRRDGSVHLFGWGGGEAVRVHVIDEKL